MKLPTRVALVALAVSAAFLAVASASADHHIAGQPHRHPHPTTTMPVSRTARHGRTMLEEHNLPSQTTTPVPTTESAKKITAALSIDKSTSVKKAQQWWGGHGGGLAYPPPGAPVYYPPEYVPHGDHFDYVPGHYHNGRKLAAISADTPAQPEASIRKAAPQRTANPNKPARAAKAQLINNGKPTPVGGKQTESAAVAERGQHGGFGGFGGGHYDYHAPSFVPHGNHFHYMPGHYDYHTGSHWGRKMLAEQKTAHPTTMPPAAANKAGQALKPASAAALNTMPTEAVKPAAAGSMKTESAAAAETVTERRKGAQVTESAQHRGGHGGWGHGGHYDYHAPSFVPHGNHFHYMPGHYDYHTGSHWGRKMLAEQKTAHPATRPAAAGNKAGQALKPAAALNTMPTEAVKPAAGSRKTESAAVAETVTERRKGAQVTESAQHRGGHGGWGHGGHYDYHAASFVPHGNHFDYVPGHYHYHEGHHGHGWGR